MKTIHEEEVLNFYVDSFIINKPDSFKNIHFGIEGYLNSKEGLEYICCWYDDYHWLYSLNNNIYIIPKMNIPKYCIDILNKALDEIGIDNILSMMQTRYNKYITNKDYNFLLESGKDNIKNSIILS